MNQVSAKELFVKSVMMAIVGALVISILRGAERQLNPVIAFIGSTLLNVFAAAGIIFCFGLLLAHWAVPRKRTEKRQEQESS